MTVLLYCPTWTTQNNGYAARPETLEAIKLLGADTVVIGTAGKRPWYDLANVTTQYLAAWKLAIDGNYDYLLTVEHDILPPDNALKLMLEADKPVVYGQYVLKSIPPTSSIWTYWDRMRIGESVTSISRDADQYAKDKLTGVIRCSGIGWGCTLIRRDVLETVTPRGDMYTDNYFAQDCMTAGFELYGHLGFCCQHWHEGRWLKEDDL